jgi:peptidoglycan-associated lipoprotein
MKIKLVYSVMLAITVAMISTGCAHKPTQVTRIPGQNPGVADINNQPPTIPYDTGMGTGHGIAATDYNPDNYTQDRSTLAGNTVYFAYDSAVIKDNEKANIQAVASEMQSDRSVHLLIEGNCDERGTEEYNRSLGERRADAAREALVSAGVDASRIHTISYGKDKPAETGHNEAAWTKNRRDEFVVLHPKGRM